MGLLTRNENIMDRNIMRKLLVTSLLLIVSLTMSFAQGFHTAEGLISAFKSKDNASYEMVSKDVMGLALRQLDQRDIKRLAKQIDRVELITLKEYEAVDKDNVRQTMTNLSGNGYEVLYESSKQGETTQALGKVVNRRVVDFIDCRLTDENISLTRVKGKIKLKDIDRLVHKLTH